MENNNKLKLIDIKNRTCYYFNDIIKIEDFDLDNILIWCILVFNIFKSLCIRLDKIDEFIRVYHGTWYLVLFWSKKYEFIYDKAFTIYLISIKSGITYIISHNYATIKVDSLSLEKTMTLRNAVILLKSVWNKDEKTYYYNIFLEKSSYELSKI